MLTIVEGSKDKLIAEMKKMKEDNRQAIKDAKAGIKEAKLLLKATHGKQFDLVVERSLAVDVARGMLNTLENELNLDLSITKLLPVELEGHVYNLKMLEELERKLKGFTITVDIDHEGLMFINYSKGGSSGIVQMHPLTPWYMKALKELPKAVSSYSIPGNKAYYKGRGWAL